LQALDGGKDGLDFYCRILKDCRGFLVPSGWLAFEIGKGQASAVSELLRNDRFNKIQCFMDHAGNDRVIMARG
jgi:release factor glutamine methyltransferase